MMIVIYSTKEKRGLISVKWQYKSLPDMLRQSSKEYKDRTAISYKKKGQIIDITYNDYYDFTLMVSRGLKKLGIKKDDKVAILSETRPMWALADFGIMNLGAWVVPIYHTNTPEQIAYILNHSQSKVVIASDISQYKKILEIKDEVPSVEVVVTHDRFIPDKKLPVLTFYQLTEMSVPLNDKERKEIEKIIDDIDTEDTFTIIYTSGTTGVPKGVELCHRNILSNIYYIDKKANNLVDKDDVFLSFLPYSHILGRTANLYMPIPHGAKVAYAESIEKVADNMSEFRPNIIITVPRLLEKMHSRILDAAHEVSEFKKGLFNKALGIGKEYLETVYVKRNKAPVSLNVKYKIYDELIFSKLREKLGLDNFKTFVSGGAPLNQEINKFFWLIGLPVIEGYGLTETSPVLCVNTFDQLKFGSVGTLLEETELKIAEDGELLFRGPQVMKGYYKEEEKTKEAFDNEGYFKTGDIGKMDEEGFIFITDRKKELIVTAGGKNIAPAPIENLLKNTKYISNAFVYGDKKPYLVAILTMDLERVLDYAKEHNLKYFDVADLAKNEKILELFRKEVGKVNKQLPRYETIKKFIIVPQDFSIEGGELTPTLKLKRRIIYKKYTDKIECLYSDDGSCYTCGQF